MKDSYTFDHTYVEIKETLDVLFRLFMNSRRSWHVYRQVAVGTDLFPVHFTYVSRTRFQPHTLSALSSFLGNLLVTMLFAENVEHQESGNDSYVTKEMYPTIIRFKACVRYSLSNFFNSLNDSLSRTMKNVFCFI